MEKQKGGLHKQVVAIFEGLHGNEDRPSGSSNASKKETAYKTSFPGNVAVMNAPQDGMNNGESADRSIDNNIKPKDEFNTQSRIPPVVVKPETPKADKAEPRDKQNRIMLPASLTVKPNFKVIDKLKAKVATLVEQHGKKQLVYLTAIPFLAIFMIFFLWRAISPPSNTAQSLADSAISAGNVENQLSLSWAKPTLFPENLRDPMKKYTSAQAVSSTPLASDLVINGIVYMEANPAESTAIIGKRTVSIGDEVSGAIVKDIQRNHVIFEVDGKLIKCGVGR